MTSGTTARIKLEQYGSALATRSRAKEVRSEIEQLAGTNSQLIFDFEGVRAISGSFADELFGDLAQRYSEKSFPARPVAIGLTAQTQRVPLNSLARRSLSEDFVPH